MQFVNFILLQLDEACRHIKDGRLAQLRLALLLLDNAAEIQMERCINNQLMYDDFNERIRNRLLEAPEEERSNNLPDNLRELIEWQPLTLNEKRSVRRYFDEKVRFLSERVKDFDVRLAKPLSYLHKYRNEAYHHAKVRKETIETAAKLLLDINCELLLNLSFGSTCFDPEEDYSWLEQRFCKKIDFVFYKEDHISNAVRDFRLNISLDDKSIGQLLTEHLHSRIENVLDYLKFIIENTSCPDREAAIKDSFRFSQSQREKDGLSKYTYDVEKRHSLSFLNELIEQLPTITEPNEKYESFNRFSLLESEFEAVEESVNMLTAAVDDMIQMEIDIARGK